jgi:hypothetical protein
MVCQSRYFDRENSGVAGKRDPPLRPFVRLLCAVRAPAAGRHYVRHFDISGQTGFFTCVNGVLMHVDHHPSAVCYGWLIQGRMFRGISIKIRKSRPFHEIEHHLSTLYKLLVVFTVRITVLPPVHEAARKHRQIGDRFLSCESLDGGLQWPRCSHVCGTGSNVPVLDVVL